MTIVRILIYHNREQCNLFIEIKNYKEGLYLKQFLVLIERKPSFSGDSIQEHRNFLQKLRAESILQTAGGFTDQTGGAYVIQANSIETAANVVSQDPMKIENHSIYTIKEWNAQ